MDEGIRERAEEMCAHVPVATRDRVVELAENVLWMECKLADARRLIGSTSVAIKYDNGGGQSGIRRNPAYDGYNALMSGYSKAVRQLTDMLGGTDADGTEGMDLDAILSGR